MDHNGETAVIRSQSAEAVPAGAAHVHPGRAGSWDERRTFRAVVLERPPLVAGWRCTVGADHSPPRHSAAPRRHHAADLPRPGAPEELRDVAVRHHPPGRDALHEVQHVLGEVVRISRHIPILVDPAVMCPAGGGSAKVAPHHSERVAAAGCNSARLPAPAPSRPADRTAPRRSAPTRSAPTRTPTTRTPTTRTLRARTPAPRTERDRTADPGTRAAADRGGKR